MRVTIVGGGQIGESLVNILSSKDYQVDIVEKDEARAKELASATEATVIKGDGTEINILKDAGLEYADAIIAATADDKTNLMVGEIAKSSKVKKIIARVNEPKNEELFTKLGIGSIIPMVSLAVTSMKRLLMRLGEERILAEIGGGEVQVVEVTVSEKSKLVGKEAAIKGAVIGTVYRGGELIIPDKSTTLKEGDVLIITVKTKDLPKLRKLISGQ